MGKRLKVEINPFNPVLLNHTEITRVINDVNWNSGSVAKFAKPSDNLTLLGIETFNDQF
jgi:hypothetical protein